MTLNILTFPKISLGLFFILMFIASFYFSFHSIVYLLMKHWLVYLFLSTSIYYLLSTSFKPSELAKKYPITSFIALLLSIIIFIADFLLLNTIIMSDRDSYETIYMFGLIILFFWVPIGLAFLNFLDYLFNPSQKS